MCTLWTVFAPTLAISVVIGTNIKKVGITSGASTPEEQDNVVINFLKPEKLIPVVGANEDISFKMPEI